MKGCLLIIGALLAVMLVAGSVRASSPRIFEEAIFLGEEVVAQAVDEGELDEMRGAYMGMSFSVVFEGYWDTLGNSFYETQGEPASAPSLPSNVRIEASVGGFYGARGVFQIVQVPGSNNIIDTDLIINISIIQVTQLGVEEIIRSLPWGL